MAYAMAGSHLANLEVVQNGLDDWFNANTLYKLFHVFLFGSILPNIGRMTTLSTVHCNATRMTRRVYDDVFVYKGMIIDGYVD